MIHKQCSACLKEGIGPKPATEFGQNSTTSDGLARHCKFHSQKFNRDHRAKHRDRIKLERRVAYRSGSVIAMALRKWGLPAAPAESEGLSSEPCPQPVNQPDAEPQPSRQSL